MLVYSQKNSPSSPPFIFLSFRITSRRDALRVAVLDADESRRPKESKSALHASCEESLSVNGRIGETALIRLRGTFHSLLLHETSHTSKSAFKDFF